jgi:SagB-type dehydrogenase family enzyme
MDAMQNGRQFLKAVDEWWNLERDQAKGVPPPPLQKPAPEGAKLINLVASGDLTVGAIPLIEAINRRRSRRHFTQEPLSLEELSFLLWATQGVHEIWQDGTCTRRTVPASCSNHPFETYLLVHRITNLERGLYQYLALDHKLCYLRPGDELGAAAEKYTREGTAAVVFVWTAVPYRTEWFSGIVAHKFIAQDSGHVCQNLYLACEAIGAGTSALGSYFQEEVDALVGVDGVDEFTVYLAPVGKVG